MGEALRLTDHEARRAAMLDHDRSILVEAGAGSGKTSLMAGRIAMMLAAGIPPKSIVAVTFTELAASDLLLRVYEFVRRLSVGEIPAELVIALPQGLSAAQTANLSAAAAALDDMACTTIHGFCQSLITPYPVEANIDPGATILDPAMADITFREIADSWLREKLDGEDAGLLGELMFHNPEAAIGLVNKILAALRQRRGLAAKPGSAVIPLLDAFRNDARAFGKGLQSLPVVEDETAARAACFANMAATLPQTPTAETSAFHVEIVAAEADARLCTKEGKFRAYGNKGRWQQAAMAAGLAGAAGTRFNDLASALNQSCCVAWNEMREAAAGNILSALLEELRPVLARFRDYKQASARLDFDDLIYAARDLLRDHDNVRRSLAARHAHVLVDEFQDTDPLQTEIFWRLCGEPDSFANSGDWKSFVIRPGALFLVGDPKQAIYRFRGADVSAYLEARDVFRAHDPLSTMSISTNFRSRNSILNYVNVCFGALLSGDGQPGFTPLNPFHFNRGDAAHLVALDVTVNGANKKIVENRRDSEAEAVADMCSQLIGSETLVDEKTGERRRCRPGDIALLAPTGSDLWRYEQALEDRGIPVATQAGKGLFRRQEIQDLIALTRLLADRRDTLALGALLRGPLVGLTDEALFDIVAALPVNPENSTRIPALELFVDLNLIGNKAAKDVLQKLQSLYRRALGTTPQNILAQAIDELRIRPLLLQRHRGQAGRALANLELFLSLSGGYAIRGLNAFAEMVTAAWEDETKAVEGRPDALEESVALYTVHAAKGLEWPIVVPINTMTGIKAPESAVTDRKTETFYSPVFGIAPPGHKDAFEAEKAQLELERIRLWYVAATRAREMLVLPRLDVPPERSCWSSLINLDLEKLPGLDLFQFAASEGGKMPVPENPHSAEVFIAEADVIQALHRKVVWHAPSRRDAEEDSVVQFEPPEILMSDRQTSEVLESSIRGGVERGLIIHKMFEEVLAGELEQSPGAIAERANVLVDQFNSNLDARIVHASEIAACIQRTLVLPVIKAMFTTLIPEFTVYGNSKISGDEHSTYGIIDAISIGDGGRPIAVVDWKSDINPSPSTVERYRSQLMAYMELVEVETGYLIFVTIGNSLILRRTQPTPSISVVI